MNYKQGLTLLKERMKSLGNDKFSEFATLEERLLNNQRDERVFGSNEILRSSRAQIIYSLNEMALKYYGMSFNDLCKEKIIPDTNGLEFKQMIESLQRIEGKIDKGRIEDRLIAIQILEMMEENRLSVSDIGQIMKELQDWADDVRQTRSSLSSDLSVLLDALAVHTSNTAQYFQLAIPIIPGIMSYNVELGSQHQLDLKAVWGKIKERVKLGNKGDQKEQNSEKLFGRGNRWAVIVGVNKYEDVDHYGELQVCVNDAEALQQQFLSTGYESDRIRLLTDNTKSELPTRENVLVALKSIAVATEPDDTLVFFYSGHGVEEDGESYLVAKNGRHMTLSDTAIMISRVKQIMGQSPARAKVIILDACHSGAQIEGKGPTHMTEEFIRRVFEQAEGLAILASCKQGQVSYEWRTNERSVFTYYLLEALQGLADLDKKGFVTVQDANRHVSNGVRLWSSQRNRSQTPTLQTEVAGDIILAYTPPTN